MAVAAAGRRERGLTTRQAVYALVALAIAVFAFLATRDLTIVRSLGDEKEPLRGGAEMVREQLFDATFPRWFADGRPTITEVMAAS